MIRQRKPIRRLSKKKARSGRPYLKRSAIKRKHRKPSEFKRIYGSRERVRWVKAQPCIYCASIAPIFGEISAGSSHNAHTVNGGTGYKADYTTIVPLCATHHARYDRHQFPFDCEETRDLVKAEASRVQKLWELQDQEHLG